MKCRSRVLASLLPLRPSDGDPTLPATPAEGPCADSVAEKDHRFENRDRDRLALRQAQKERQHRGVVTWAVTTENASLVGRVRGWRRVLGVASWLERDVPGWV